MHGDQLHSQREIAVDALITRSASVTLPVSTARAVYRRRRHPQDPCVNGQIATQYTDHDGVPSMDIRFNPNGSVGAVEGIFSPDGRVFGKMALRERTGEGFSRISRAIRQHIFRAGVDYFRYLRRLSPVLMEAGILKLC